MSKYRAENLRQHLRNGILLRNPVLVQAIGLFVVVAVSTSALSALLFAVVSAVILIILEIITNLILKQIPQWLRVGFYTIISFAITIPFYILANKYAPDKLGAASIYLPILSINALTSYRCERIAVTSTLKNSFWDAVTSSLGYGAVLFSVGFIRELLGKGAVFGYQIPNFPTVSGLLMPFGGFIIIGFMAALLKWISSRRYGYEATETAVDHIRDEEWEEKDGLRSLFGQSTIAGKLKVKESQLREKAAVKKKEKAENDAKKQSAPKQDKADKKPAEKQIVKKEKQQKPVKPAKPVKQDKPAKQEKTAKPTKPVKPAKPAKPAKQKPVADILKENKITAQKTETKVSRQPFDDDLDFGSVLDNYRKRQSDKNDGTEGGKD